MNKITTFQLFVAILFIIDVSAHKGWGGSGGYCGTCGYGGGGPAVIEVPQKVVVIKKTKIISVPGGYNQPGPVYGGCHGGPCGGRRGRYRGGGYGRGQHKSGGGFRVSGSIHISAGGGGYAGGGHSGGCGRGLCGGGGHWKKK